MNNEIRKLSMDELDLVSGGGIITDAMDYAIGKDIEWLRTNVPNINLDDLSNTTGRGDNNGCTGNKC